MEYVIVTSEIEDKIYYSEQAKKFRILFSDNKQEKIDLRYFGDLCFLDIRHPKTELGRYFKEQDELRSFNEMSYKQSPVIKRRLPITRLTFTQYYVDRNTVLRYAKCDKIKPVTVLQKEGTNVLVDGTHRAISRWLRSEARVLSSIYKCPIELLITEEEKKRIEMEMLREFFALQFDDRDKNT